MSTHDESDHDFEEESSWPSPATENEELGHGAVQDKRKPKSYDVEARNLTAADFLNMIKAELVKAEQVMLLFGLHRPETALGLLRKYRWSLERLKAKYPRRPAPTLPLPTLPSARNPFCPICGNDRSPTMACLQCGHKFCTNCWQRYLKDKIIESGLCDIHCMQNMCEWLTPGSFIRELCGDELHKRFEELLLRKYVQQIPYLKFCPAPDCPGIVSCPMATSKSALQSIVPTVTCSIGHTFCFGCHINSDHRPILCGIAKQWLSKCQRAEIKSQLDKHQERIATIRWIDRNTKKCPGCSIPIQKNGGCNHMTCKKCRHQFCWLCLDPWEGHSCNSYAASSTRQQRDAIPESSALPPEMETFFHYYHRWKNHERSAELSADLLAKTERKMEEMQRTGSRWIEVQFLKEGMENVRQCRRTLQWTYVMAYYMEESNFKGIFEDNQGYLENAVEDFTELLESRIEPDTVVELLSKIKDKGVYVQMRNEKMLEGTADGFKEGQWTWNKLRLEPSGGQKSQVQEPDQGPGTNLVHRSHSRFTDPAAHIYINAPWSLYIRLVGLLTLCFMSFLAGVRRIVPFGRT